MEKTDVERSVWTGWGRHGGGVDEAVRTYRVLKKSRIIYS